MRRDRPRRRRNLQPALWAAPAIVSMLFVYGYGIYRLLEEATHREGRSVGLENLRIAVDDPFFRTAVGNNLRLLLTLPVIIGIALVIAILLFEGLRGWRFHRVAVFIPYMLPVTVVGVLFGQLLTLHGAVNTSLDAVGLGRISQDWLGNPDWALRSLAGVIIWRELGFGVILFLARLLSLPQNVFDAARVDGAGWFRMHRSVTLPMMRSIIGFYFVVEAITLMSWVFSYVFVMTGGGPGQATQVTETYIYQNAFASDLPWLAAAAATVLLIAVTAIAGVLLLGRFGYRRWRAA
ncbi:MAG TPA: sugar ABC transporter permease [Gaiellales bacterium]|nr:sugar ABC transporter permease [Gaiellales bacterium]